MTVHISSLSHTLEQIKVETKIDNDLVQNKILFIVKTFDIEDEKKRVDGLPTQKDRVAFLKDLLDDKVIDLYFDAKQKSDFKDECDYYNSFSSNLGADGLEFIDNVHFN